MASSNPSSGRSAAAAMLLPASSTACKSGASHAAAAAAAAIVLFLLVAANNQDASCYVDAFSATSSSSRALPTRAIMPSSSSSSSLARGAAARRAANSRRFRYHNYLAVSASSASADANANAVVGGASSAAADSDANDDDGDGDEEVSQKNAVTRSLAMAEAEEEQRLADLERAIREESDRRRRPSDGEGEDRTFDSGTRIRNGVIQNVDGGNSVYSEPMVVSTSGFGGAAGAEAEADETPEERQGRIDSMLEADDQEWRDRRRREKMGRYADASSREELERIAAEEKEEIAQENERKAEAAGKQGVSLEMLDPVDGGGTVAAGGVDGFNIKGRGRSWFDDVDKELRQEMDELGVANGDSEGGPTMIDGKVTSRDKLQGVRVGSAGGWQLEIYPGDFVVHRKYGIGRFEKTVLQPKKKLTKAEKEAQRVRREELLREKIAATGKKSLPAEEIQKIMKSFGTAEDDDPISNPRATLLEIAYSDAIVHVPVDRAYRLSRYRAGDSVVKPKLSRVKGGAWEKAKSKVAENTIVMAQDVLALYATRESLSRPPCNPNVEGQVRDFEETFSFEPTPDQITCFEHVENDMVWRSRPMDRLVCGDVGFGKTEVALRALFRAVANGKQAAMLAPTGVLAAQHYKNVLKRMGEETNFNVTVGMLRGGMGKNTKKGRELREEIAEGKIQLIVGTHAILGNSMKFKDLSLLVIDEEQRFGVKQKERLKVISNGVDVLTLSATPIPRTLQMSLSGVRDTSTIRTAPPMRKATITAVEEFGEDVVYEAIRRERERGGQCYYVLPRIADLEEAEIMLKKLFPDIRIIMAHGRMGRGAEENVEKFAEGDYDVLLATTVIENGVDIPSVNTIIVQNAQSLGMSTLYQLKGRVGRSNVQAYAYFLHRPEAITEQSAMRLQAMADFSSELGSGFDVANRDLEIRGAGSLLGTEQSGMAAKVGFDLYMRMLKKSVRQLRGLDLPAVARTNVILPKGEGSIEVGDGSSSSNAFQINKSYIKDPAARLREESAARLAESTSQLVELTNLWKDTYGPIPPKVQKQLKTLHLHACTRILGIDLVGMVTSIDAEGTKECILRSPGLRLRHWIEISRSLPRGAPTKGLDVILPSRFNADQGEVEIRGGKKIDMSTILVKTVEENVGEEEEEWDALDQEEVESMKEISSALNVKAIDEVDVENYPRFLIRDFDAVKQGQRIDALLKALLPASKVVFEKQKADKEKAKVAAELREKREMMRKQQKERDSMSARNLGLGGQVVADTF
mmetsp:Transcript_4509/g.12702  ORF Transcript_4509/g.12702 Transcript_4509/m.12702 type:complete len:1259 (-) Transcript_4509:34-3810(-)